MVAHLVGLRFRLLRHALTRSPWHIVGLVLGLIGALWMLALVGGGLVAVRALAPQLAPDLLVIAGVFLVLGWIVGSVVVAGMDDALAPERFAVLPVRAAQLQPGLLLAGLAGIPGIATAIALLASLIGWSVDVPTLLAALATVPLALATCFLLARVTTLALGTLLADRRSRDLMTTLAVLSVVGASVLFQLILPAALELGEWSAQLATAANVAAWTPFGAAFGVPHAVHDRAWLVAAAQALIALATVVAAWFVWRRQLAARLVSPIQAHRGGTVRGGGLVDRMFPATPTGAIAARSLRLRRRDPRHIINLITLLVMPLLLIVPLLLGNIGSNEGGLGFGSIVAFAPVVAVLLLGTIVQMDLAYDGPALALHALTGVSGRADRAGRVLGIGVIAGPALLVTVIVSVWLTGDWSLLGTSMGLTLGIGMVVAGIASWIGAYWPGHAPPAGANPFGRGSSGGAETMLGMLAINGMALVVSTPIIVAAVTTAWLPWMSWVTLAVGLAVGAVVLWLGIRLGGRVLDRRWPEVLRSVSLET